MRVNSTRRERQPGAVHRYAVVIGSNEARGQPLAPLEFADDDALNNCELLAELEMDVQVFTRMDSRTAIRHPSGGNASAHPVSRYCSPRPPEVTPVQNAIEALAREVKSAPTGTRNIETSSPSGSRAMGTAPLHTRSSNDGSGCPPAATTGRITSRASFGSSTRSRRAATLPSPCARGLRRDRQSCSG